MLEEREGELLYPTITFDQFFSTDRETLWLGVTSSSGSSRDLCSINVFQFSTMHCSMYLRVPVLLIICDLCQKKFIM